MSLSKENVLNKGIAITFLFYLLYLPKITELFFNVQSQIIVVVLFLLFAFFRLYNIFDEQIEKYESKKSIIKWGFFIIYLSCYTGIIAMIHNKPNRIFQYSFVLIWLLTLYWFKKIVLESFFTNSQILEIIFILGALQGAICIIMLAFPQFKEISNQLYWLGEERNVFRTEKRIYGISNDYTFFTPCYHGFLASFCLLYSVMKKKSFIIAVPLIFIATFMNNRTGLIIFLINTIVVIAVTLLDKKVDEKYKIALFKSIIVLLLFIFIALLFIKNYNVKTYDYTIKGVLNASEWAEEQNGQVYFPDGIDFIFGNGDIQAGVTRRKYGWISDRISDYGYVNDMFIGGLLYCIALYLNNILFLFTGFNKKVSNFEMVYFSITSTITLLISNYKGQSMKSGFLLVAILFIKLILLDIINEEEENVCQN